MSLGTSQERKNEAGASGSEFYKLKEGLNVHRVMEGMVLRETIFWQSLTEFNGQPKQVTRLATREVGKKTIFDDIANVDIALKSALGWEKPSSELTPQKKYIYLIIDKDIHPYVIKPIGYPKSVHDEICSKEEMLKHGDPTMLMYGLSFMFDWHITRKFDPTKGGAKFGTSYKTDVSPNYGKIYGNVPAILANVDASEWAKHGLTNVRQFFNDEEWKAHEDQSCQLDDIMAPKSAEEIKTALIQNPIYVEAKDKNGNYLYPNRPALYKKMAELSIPFIKPIEQLPPAENPPINVQDQAQPPKETEILSVQNEAEKVKFEAPDIENAVVEDVVESKPAVEELTFGEAPAEGGSGADTPMFNTSATADAIIDKSQTTTEVKVDEPANPARTEVDISTAMEEAPEVDLKQTPIASACPHTLNDNNICTLCHEKILGA